MQTPILSRLLWLSQYIVLVSASNFALVERASASAVPTPISVAPSQNWDGDDGPWSSFTIQVGTPIQDVRVFVSNEISTTWIVETEGCAVGDDTCSNGRGLLFNPNSSSTWSQYGFYALGAEQNLGSTGSARYGNDTVGLGIQGSGGPSLPDQIVGAFSTDDFYLGFFGVNPASTNFTQQEQGKASYMTTLKNQNLIPSLSFGYTAGNKYRLKQVLGSLTLGGVDSGRFVPNNLSISFAPQEGRSLLVGIQSISSVDQNGTTSNLLPNGGIMALVDSTEAQIWLPVEACQAFETAFGLTYNDTNGFYLVDDALSSQLTAQNASVTFTLGNSTSGGETINITLPYASFDLLLTPPAANLTSNTNYFPLRRADNSTQYTLGRTFLQEAYLTVDWERQNFSISECLFSEDMQQTLVAIQAPSDTTSSGGSSTGKTVGIAVGVVVGVLVIAAAIGAFLWKKRQTKRESEKEKAEKAKMLDNDMEDQHRQGFKQELGVDNEHQRFEMQGSTPEEAKAKAEAAQAQWIDEKARYPGERSGIAEVAGGDVSRSEIAAGDVSRPELPSSQGGPLRPFHELYDPSAPPAELPGDPVGELEGSVPALSSQTSFSSSRRRSLNRNNPGSPLSQSSGRFSVANKVSRGKRQARDSIPSLHATAPTPPPKPAAGLSSPPPSVRPTSRRNPSNDIYSPLSNEDMMSPGSAGVTVRGGTHVVSPDSPVDPEASRTSFWARMTGKKH
ncbi:hypothetical protein HO133_005920 [Letharia lupina]|uniref:Peptidase A1 domain-containing protein n=1 Tax=Letharia lupina TaxID=560253 RepID=A0A8H6F7Z7_9LECA|nr:uncharacterized protein HO133_005920 [Letharia lupina]KAF6218570.1 hypothetical protein HO133_005920 [Letharia lupina]